MKKAHSNLAAQPGHLASHRTLSIGKAALAMHSETALSGGSDPERCATAVSR